MRRRLYRLYPLHQAVRVRRIHMDNNVAVIDYEKCTNCGKCAEKCPVKIIQ